MSNCLTLPGLTCSDCRMSPLCLPLSLHADEIGQLDAIVSRGRPIHKDDYVYHSGNPFHSIFAVRSGAIKTYAVDSDGHEQVTGFHLPGEIFGIDGIGQESHRNTAVALETSSVCEIPFNRLSELSIALPTLQKRLFALMGMEVNENQELITLLSKKSAEERVATLLLNLSARNHARKLSSIAFRLPMSRSDIGNYLGLTLETVSRVFSRFQKTKLLSVDKKEIEILDMEGLRSLISGHDTPPCSEKAG